jgi:hypothetical protein
MDLEYIQKPILYLFLPQKQLFSFLIFPYPIVIRYCIFKILTHFKRKKQEFPYLPTNVQLITMGYGNIKKEKSCF